MSQPARARLESLLRTRKLDVTLTTSAPWLEPVADAAATGIAVIDDTLGGGLRRGHLSEITGPPSSGRTTVMCGVLAEATGRGEAVAVVDASDRFDPQTAEEAGVDLATLLWVRERGDPSRALKALNLVLQAGGFGIVVFDLCDVRGLAVRQFPHTTWMRIARTIEGSQTVALLVGGERLARSPGGVTIALDAPRARWTGTAARARLLRGIELKPRVVGGKG